MLLMPSYQFTQEKCREESFGCCVSTSDFSLNLRHGNKVTWLSELDSRTTSLIQTFLQHFARGNQMEFWTPCRNASNFRLLVLME